MTGGPLANLGGERETKNLERYLSFARNWGESVGGKKVHKAIQQGKKYSMGMGSNERGLVRRGWQARDLSLYKKNSLWGGRIGWIRIQLDTGFDLNFRSISAS